MGITLAGFTLAGWVYLLIARGRFWRMREDLSYETFDAARNIAVVIPARDEAASIARAVSSLLQQNITGRLKIFVVDDNSTDGTGRIASEAARLMGASEHLQVVDAGPLPIGWTGKLWAVSQGLKYAAAMQPDYVLLTDADIEHGPGVLADLVACAERGGFDLTSLMVRLRCESSAERALVPAFVFFFFMLYPPPWIRERTRRTAGAAGGCMLLRRHALERIGGVACIRGELIDDCALARVVKGSGGRVWLGATQRTHSLREYPHVADVWNMIARTAFTQLNYSFTLLVGMVAGMAVLFVAPPLLLLAPRRTTRLLAGSTCACMMLAFIPVNRFYRQSVFRALLLPAIATFYVGATIASAWRHSRGRGGAWKGRVREVA